MRIVRLGKYDVNLDEIRCVEYERDVSGFFVKASIYWKTLSSSDAICVILDKSDIHLLRATLADAGNLVQAL